MKVLSRLVEGHCNRATIYLLPMLAASKYDVYLENIVNVYIGDNRIPDLNEHIFIMYNKQDNVRFNNLKTYLKNHTSFVLEYEIDDKLVFVFKIPSNYYHDYKCFLRGQYSKFNEKYKKHIINFFDLRDSDSICGVLYKREARFKELEEFLDVKIPRNLECGSIYDEKYEIIGNLEEDITSSS